MANVFKSKEVYEHRNIVNPGSSEHHIVPVQGVFVSDLWTQPYYIDHMLTIDAIENVEATIVDYTSSSYDLQNAEAFESKVMVNNVIPTVVHYQTSSATGYHDDFATLSITNTQSPLTIIDFYTIDADSYTEDFHGCSLTYEQNPLTCVNSMRDDLNALDCCIQITEITSRDATIT